MSKIVSGIGKAVGGIVSGVVKTFKNVVSSVTHGSLGKVLMLAAAIYLGGAAFGAWESPFAQLNGVLSGTPAATAASETTSLASQTLEAGSVTTGSEAAAAANATPAATAAAENTVGNGAANWTGGMDPVTGEAMGNAAPAAQAAAPSVSASAPSVDPFEVDGSAASRTVSAGLNAPPMERPLVSRFMNGVGEIADSAKTFVKDNPMAAYMLGNTAANAFAPNAIDQINASKQAQMDLYDWKQRYAAPNWNVSGVSLGFQPGTKQLKTSAGAPVYAPTGMINTAMKG